MSGRRDGARVLAVAAGAADRDALCALLDESYRVEGVGLSALGDAAESHEPMVLVALVGNEDDLAVLLAAVPSGRDLVLIAGALPEAALATALARLDPAACLAHPAPPAALRWAVERVLRNRRARGAIERRRTPGLVGISAAIREVIEQVQRIARADVSVLVLGETGTGKEIVARAIHESSRRAGGPFVAVNCSALPDTLLESELFGFSRGAFTGALRAKRGLFEQAHGGTLFLDEVGDMSPLMQAKLLRALEERSVRPLGSEDERPVDVRVVAATHRNLEIASREGDFRQDLYYRLAGATIEMPPLRRRRVDIPLLAQHFAAEIGATSKRRVTLGEDFLAALAVRSFPGNVRELRNAVERALALAPPDAEVSAELLPAERTDGDGAVAEAAPGSLRERIERLEISLISEALAQHRGNRTRVARALGLSRLGLRQKMRRLGLA